MSADAVSVTDVLMTASPGVIYSRFASSVVIIEVGCSSVRLFLRERVAVTFTPTVAPLQVEKASLDNNPSIF
jgi:hypothetical protein